MKYIEPSEKVEKQLRSGEVVKNYGRSSKLLLAEKDIPDLHFDVKDNGDSPEKTDVMELMNVNTEDCVTVPWNSNFREHLRNSLENAAGEELDLVSEQRSLKQALNSKLHSNTSEYREDSQKSRDNGNPTRVETPGKLVKRIFSRDMHLQHSECREHSQNSRIKQAVGVAVTVNAEYTKRSAASSNFPEDSQNSLPSSERETDNGEANMSFGDRDDHCSVVISEFRELSPNSQVETEGSEGRQKKQHTKPVCASEPSEYSRDSLHVGNNVSVPSFSWLKSMSQIVGLTATWQDKVEGNPTGANTASNAKVNISPVHTKFNFFL